MARTAEYVGLGWRHGSLSLQRFGGMLAPVTFIVGEGRQVAPLYLAPWAAGEPSPALPEVLKHFRGEWPCVPFGSYRHKQGFPPEWAAVIGDGDSERYLHGFSSNVDWRWSRLTPDDVELACRYPEEHDIEELVRRVTPVRDCAAIDIELIVRARRRTRLPVGLHFTFASPRTEALLRPGIFRDAWTYRGANTVQDQFAPQIFRDRTLSRSTQPRRSSEAPTRKAGHNPKPDGCRVSQGF